MRRRRHLRYNLWLSFLFSSSLFSFIKSQLNEWKCKNEMKTRRGRIYWHATLFLLILKQCTEWWSEWEERDERRKKSRRKKRWKDWARRFVIDVSSSICMNATFSKNLTRIFNPHLFSHPFSFLSQFLIFSANSSSAPKGSFQAINHRMNKRNGRKEGEMKQKIQWKARRAKIKGDGISNSFPDVIIIFQHPHSKRDRMISGWVFFQRTNWDRRKENREVEVEHPTK